MCVCVPLIQQSVEIPLGTPHTSQIGVKGGGCVPCPCPYLTTATAYHIYHKTHPCPQVLNPDAES